MDECLYINIVPIKGSNSKKKPCSVMTKALDHSLKVSLFELQSHYYNDFRTNTFGKCMNPSIHPNIGWTVSLQFSKDSFDIELTMKVNIP